jgi:hypothetical protein
MFFFSHFSFSKWQSTIVEPRSRENNFASHLRIYLHDNKYHNALRIRSFGVVTQNARRHRDDNVERRL